MFILSGIDEQGSIGIPPCPYCREKTKYWNILAKGDGYETCVGYLNYCIRQIKMYSEFNITGDKEYALKHATSIQCHVCKYTDNDKIFKSAIRAWSEGIWRFPQYQG